VDPVSDEEDTQLFRDAVRDVKPLGGGRPVAGPKSALRRYRLPRQNQKVMLDAEPPGSANSPVIEREDELSFRRPGVQIALLRKLRRAEWGIQGEIDLHGLTGDQATRVLHEFIDNAVARQARCVRIIHGKGLRSSDRLPVLKNVVSQVLRRMPAVMAFVSAKQNDGGTGATYVLLRS